MDLNKKVLSDIVVFNKYAKYIEEKQRRETFEEIVDRCKDMHKEHFKHLGNDFIGEIDFVFDNYVKTKKVLPSMRVLQFGGKAIEMNPARGYNCSYVAIDNIASFPEAMFLLLSGTGVGFSVQKHHVEKLPPIKRPTKTRRYVIGDCIEGWADAVKMLCKAYFKGNPLPLFDYRDIREKGAPLITSGGKAPGAEPLRNCLHKIKMIFDRKKDGDQLTTIESHDIVCHIADAVLSGGIRRAACISLFSIDDEDMLSCKSGNWWEINPQRGRANNSVMVIRHKVKKADFLKLWNRVHASGCGEPGLYFSNNSEYGVNPCTSGDTEILTDSGYKRIDSLVEQEINIWNGFEWSKVTPKITGENQEMLKVKFSDGRELKCTKYHTFHIVKDYRGNTQEIQAKDLTVGMKLIKHEFPIIQNGESISKKIAYTQGFISAEGMDDYKNFSVYHPKEMCIPRLEGKSFSRNDIKTYFSFKHDVHPKSFVPFNWDLSSKVEWLSGLLDGDGCELKEGGCQLASVDFPFLNDLQKMLSTIGIQSKVIHAYNAGNRMLPDGHGGSKEYYCQEARRICIGAVQIQELKKLGLNCSRLKFDKEPQRDALQFVKIVDIQEIETHEKVYCFNEPLRHLGIFNGVITGQCCEIALKSSQMCNLTTMNASDLKDQTDLEERCYAASFIGTIQAAYTDFYYLRDTWKRNCEKEALLGVSMTGIASNEYIKCDLKAASGVVKDVNQRVSKTIGINPAARTTCVKPEGTTSLVFGSSSGIHAWFAPYYIRRMKVGKNESIYKYLQEKIPNLLEDDIQNPTKDALVCIPIAAPEGAITSESETPFQLLERIKTFSDNWIKPGHVKGDNTHNVSATVYIKEDEWDSVSEWMWNHRDSYNGLSVLPFDNGTYKQTPFERISKEKYEELSVYVKDVDLTQVIEGENHTDLKGELACSSGICEISF